jgi:hypothetical protein
MMGMRSSIDKICSLPIVKNENFYALIDGNKSPKLGITSRAVIKVSIMFFGIIIRLSLILFYTGRFSGVFDIPCKYSSKSGARSYHD